MAYSASASLVRGLRGRRNTTLIVDMDDLLGRQTDTQTLRIPLSFQNNELYIVSTERICVVMMLEHL